MSLSFYGKRPGPGMKLDKISMQLLHPGDRPQLGDVLEAYERLILDAMRGDQYAVRPPPRASQINGRSVLDYKLLDDPPPVKFPLSAGNVGSPNVIHQSDRTERPWRLPLPERAWREKKMEEVAFEFVF